MNDWDNYRLILALERSDSLRGAAEVLGVNHSTVSRKLTQLNKYYGEAVFERTPQGYKASTLGRELVISAKRIEDITLSNIRLQRSKQKGLRGPITLSVPPPIAQFLLLEELKKFRKENPFINLTVQSTFSLVNLDRSEADLVIRGSDNPPEHWVGRRVASVKLNYYAQREYFENTKEDNLQWIGKNSDETLPEWIKTSPFPSAAIGIRSDNIMMRHHFAKAGHGLTRGACYMAEQEPKLIRITSNDPIHYSDLWVLTHPDLRDTPRIKILMQYLCAALDKKRALLEGK